MTKRNGSPRPGELTPPRPLPVKATDFQVISFHDPLAVRQDGKRGAEVILIYALGEDGVVREFANGRWTSFPI